MIIITQQLRQRLDHAVCYALADRNDHAQFRPLSSNEFERFKNYMGWPLPLLVGLTWFGRVRGTLALRSPTADVTRDDAKWFHASCRAHDVLEVVAMAYEFGLDRLAGDAGPHNVVTLGRRSAPPTPRK
jgi:hypothetical protein